MSHVTVYEVGGYVRDSLLGVESKDVDFSVEADSFEAMRDYLLHAGFSLFLVKQEYLTIRARFPVTDLRYSGLTADFVLCRKEGEYSDGRRPDSVSRGTIYDDLARRDFTVNAIARHIDGGLIDPHHGEDDLHDRVLRAVGNPKDRIEEDSLRALRAIRFAITKGFVIEEELDHVLSTERTARLLSNVSVERIREELEKCFKHDTLATLAMLDRFPKIRNVVFSGKLRLSATLKG